MSASQPYQWRNEAESLQNVWPGAVLPAPDNTDSLPLKVFLNGKRNNFSPPAETKLIKLMTFPFAVVGSHDSQEVTESSAQMPSAIGGILRHNHFVAVSESAYKPSIF